MLEKFKRLFHFIGIHDWDYKNADCSIPKIKRRSCRICHMKQVWESYPPHIAILTDKPMGGWRRDI